MAWINDADIWMKIIVLLREVLHQLPQEVCR